MKLIQNVLVIVRILVLVVFGGVAHGTGMEGVGQRVELVRGVPQTFLDILLRLDDYLAVAEEGPLDFRSFLEQGASRR